MDNSENKAKGIVQISDEVISLIANTAATEVEGVAYVNAATNGNLMDKIGKKSSSKGVVIVVDEGKVSVDINIVVMYEYNIQKVAKKVQNNVKNVIETMTNMETSVVNVNVVGLELKKQSKEQ